MNKRGKRGRAAKQMLEPLKQMNQNAAGIDVGAESHWVAVPSDRDEKPVQEFGACTSELERLAQWLAKCKVTAIAMESTGVYWIALFELLEGRGFEVKLVDPHHLKSVPGRKTDVVDCQWIQQLHTYGLLSGAFRPEEKVSVLRSYLRQREMLAQNLTQHIQHMQKAMTQMNVKLQHVVGDITGVTGMRIIKAILSGERNERKLAKLRDPKCRHSEREIAEALRGTWRPEHLFALKQAVELYEFYAKQIEACDVEIEKCLKDFEDRSGGGSYNADPWRRTTRAGALNFDPGETLFRMAGVDLTKVDGLDRQSVLKLLSEIGVDMSAWPDEKHFTSWMSVCPGNKISGGKRLSGRTKPNANRAAHILRIAAQALWRSKSALGAFYRRMRSKLGAPKAITATAHKLARIVYRMLKYRKEYVDLGQEHYENQYKARVLINVQRRAKEFGYKLVKIRDLAPVAAS